MDSIYFSTVTASAKRENNSFFYRSAEEAKKDTESKVNEEVQVILKLINDYSLDVPIMKQLLRGLHIKVEAREFVMKEAS